MIRDFDILAARIALQMGSATVRFSLRSLNQERAKLRSLSDEALVDLFTKYRAGLFGKNSKPRDFQSLVQRLIQLVTGSASAQQTHEMSKVVALGAEAFRRAPADLPPDTTLYPQQLRAAIALTQSCVVQMNTGEGKTYAILPAALALICRYGTCCIICANDYLAERDARRTLPFWSFFNVSVGLALDSSPESEWSKQIVYTTLSRYAFKVAQEEIERGPTRHPVHVSALLVDDADAVLLDGAFTDHSIVAHLKPELFDWDTALQLADLLVADEHIRSDKLRLQSILTIEGEEHLRKLVADRYQGETGYLLLRHSVELAYFSKYVAERDVHYVVEGDHVYPINNVTGQIERGVNPNWLASVRVMLGLPPTSLRVTQHRVQPASLFQEAPHISGISGTVKDDGLEYLFSYRLPAVIIEPRFPRRGKLLNDQVLKTRDEAIEHVSLLAQKAAAADRPVLIGTQTISEAEDVYRFITQDSDNGLQINLLTARNDGEAAAFYAQAGQSGTVTISTQLSGRGVDIRLSDSARSAGGLALISLGHADEPRHDRQFEGRAGRQGDPFSIVYILHLSDHLMSRFKGQRMEKMLNHLGLERGEAVVHSWVDKAVRNAQRKLRLHNFVMRRTSDETAVIESEARRIFRLWFDVTSADEADWALFVERTVTGFVSTQVDPVITDNQELSLDTSESLVAGIEQKLDSLSIGFSAIDLEGSTKDEASQLIRSGLTKQIQQTWEDADAVRAQFFAKLERQAERQEAEWTATREFLESEIRALMAAQVTQGAIDLEAEPAETPEAPQEHPIALFDYGWQDQTGNEDEPPDSWESIYSQACRRCSHLGREERAEDPLANALSSYQSIPGPENATRAARRRAGQMLSPDEVTLFQALAGRPPGSVAYWSLRACLAEHWEQVDATKFLVGQATMHPVDLMRQTRDRLDRINSMALGTVPLRILQSLLKATDPRLLDDLFVVPENSVNDDNPARARWREPLVPDGRRAGIAARSRDQAEELIARFFSVQFESIEGLSITPQKARKVLRQFLQNSPLPTLTTQIGVAEALHSWRELEEVFSTDRRTRADSQKLIREFLSFLCTHNLAAPLPWRIVVIQANLRSAILNLGRDTVALSVAGTIAFICAILLLMNVQIVAEMPRFSAGLGSMDQLAFGGLLQQGMIAAPIIFAILGGALLAGVLKPDKSLADHVDGLGGFLGWPICLSATIGMLYVGTTIDGPLDYVLQGGVAIAVLFLFNISKNSMIVIRRRTGIPLLSLWMVYSVGIVFASAIAAASSHPVSTLILLLVGVFIAIGWRQVNRIELLFIALRFRPDTAQADDQVVGRAVEGSAGMTPLVLGIAGVWSLGTPIAELLVPHVPSGGTLVPVSDIVGILIFFAVWETATLYRLGGRLNPRMWAKRISARRQVYKSSDGMDTLEAALRRTKFRLLLRESAYQAVLLGALLLAGHFIGLQGRIAEVPLVLWLLLIIVVVSREGEALALQVYGFLCNRATTTREVYEEVHEEDEDQRRAFLSHIGLALRKNILFFGTAFLLLLKVLTTVIDTVGVYDFFARFWDLVP